MAVWLLRWLLVVAMFVGAYLMWPSVISATAAGRVSPGQFTWLQLGIGLLFFQAHLAIKLALNSIGKPEKALRWAIAVGVWINVGANGWENILLWYLAATGAIVITPQDTMTAWLSFVAFAAVMLWTLYLRADLLGSVPMFLLAVISRVIPQGMLIAPRRMMLAYNTCLGLLLIASQRTAMMGIEVWRAGKKHAKLATTTTAKALDAAQWIWWSDIANCLTAMAIFSTWIVQH